jgi:hypothetical protein
MTRWSCLRAVSNNSKRAEQRAEGVAMEFEEFEILARNARAATVGEVLPEGFQLFDSWRASEAEIQHVESRLNVRLPEKYKEFMRRRGGGVFLYVELLPIASPGERSEDLMGVNSSEFRVDDFIAVSPVGTGDWWGFSVLNGVCGDAVDMWIHDDGTIERTDSDFLEFAARQGLRAM